MEKGCNVFILGLRYHKVDKKVTFSVFFPEEDLGLGVKHPGGPQKS